MARLFLESNSKAPIMAMLWAPLSTSSSKQNNLQWILPTTKGRESEASNSIYLNIPTRL